MSPGFIKFGWVTKTLKQNIPGGAVLPPPV